MPDGGVIVIENCSATESTLRIFSSSSLAIEHDLKILKPV
jgi:hypothetical protein